MRPCLEKPFTKIGLLEWLKVKALSSSPRPTKKKRKKESMSLAVVAHAYNPSTLQAEVRGSRHVHVWATYAVPG
jgi:hypothetical protein